MSKALTFIYRFTFIDVDDVEVEATGLRKSESMPVLSTTFDPDIEAHVSETQQREYVNSLPNQAAPAPRPVNRATDGPEVVEEQAEMPAEPVVVQNGEVECEQATEKFFPPPSLDWPSCGSVGHPELCCRPCVHYGAGRCAEGNSCGYCHMQHHVQPKLDKLQRTFVQELPPAALLATILPCLHARAEASGIAEPASSILRLVEAKLAELGAPEPGRVNLKKLKNLGKALSKMSFSNLLKLAGRAPLPEAMARELREALEALRQQFASMPPTEIEARITA
mmetsp:Transcript_107310/g.256230  ORF Transcript_107310/g.256230 Transcript_107310/m.256230 type:complete len:280 (-) Transcript_107310:205-1044(-)